MAGGYDGGADPLLTMASAHGVTPQMLALALQRQQNASAMTNIEAAGENPKGAVGVGLNLMAEALRSSHQKDLIAQSIAQGQAQQAAFDGTLRNNSGVPAAGGAPAAAAPVAGSPGAPTPASAGPAATPDAASQIAAASVGGPAPAAAAPASDGSVRGDLQAAFAQQAQGDPDATAPQARNASVMIGPNSHSPMTASDGGGSVLHDGDGGSMPDGADMASPSPNGINVQPSPAMLAAALGGPGVQPSPQVQAMAQSQFAPTQGAGAAPPQMAGQPPPNQLALNQPPPGPTPAGGGAGSSAAISPAQRAFTYFTGQGYSPQAAAGIVGNIQQESGFNPQAYNQAERAGGLMQWRGARLDGLKQFAAANGSTPDDFNTQLAYVNHELQTTEGGARSALMSASDPASAAYAAASYLRPAGYRPGGDPSAISGWSNRANAAVSAMTAFGGQGGGGPPSAGYQVAQNGPLTIGPPGGAGQSPQAPQGPQGPQGAPPMASPSSGPPQPQLGPPASPREIQTINQFMASGVPELRQKAEALMQSIADRQRTPIDMEAHLDPNTGITTYVPKIAGYGQPVSVAPPPGWRPSPGPQMQYGANGVAQPIAGTTSRPLINPQERAAYGIGPNDRNAYEIDPKGVVSKVADGTFQPLPASQRAAYGIAPSDRSGYAVGSDGKLVQTAADPFGPSQQIEYASKFLAVPQVKDYVQLRQFHDAAQLAARQQGGPADLQILDMALKSNNPTLGIRPNQVDQMMSELGLPNQFKGELQSLVQNGGKLSPAARSAMMNVIDNQMSASWNSVQPMMAKAQRDAKKFGLDTEDLIPGLTPPPPAGSSGSGFGPATRSDPSALIAAGRAAIQRGAPRAAVLQRLQQQGINAQGQL